jgi:hypothetical protein
MGLNGVLTLYSAYSNRQKNKDVRLWKKPLAKDQRQEILRALLVGRNEILVDADLAPVRRDCTPPQTGTLPIRNVVVILMESFAGRYVGTLGDIIFPDSQHCSLSAVLMTSMSTMEISPGIIRPAFSPIRG